MSEIMSIGIETKSVCVVLISGAALPKYKQLVIYVKYKKKKNFRKNQRNIPNLEAPPEGSTYHQEGEWRRSEVVRTGNFPKLMMDSRVDT